MSVAHISCRAGTANDAESMVGLHFAAVQAIGTEHYSPEILLAWSPPPDDRRRRWLANLIQQDSTLCTLAIAAQERIVGFSIAMPAQSRIQATYVHPGYARMGIGKALLLHVESQLRGLGLEVAELNASYNAERFYNRQGYESVGPTTQPLTETLAMGAIHMVKRIARVA